MNRVAEEPRWLPRAAIEAAQADQIRTHGGQLGLRDEGLLESALARAKQRWHYAGDADLADLAAAYGCGLVGNHPFLDGNKRIGLIAMNMFLILNGKEIEAAEPEIVEKVLGIAKGEIDEETLSSWLRSVLVPYAP